MMCKGLDHTEGHVFHYLLRVSYCHIHIKSFTTRGCYIEIK